MNEFYHYPLHHAAWPILPEAALALILSNTLQQHEGPVLIACRDMLTVDRLKAACLFFSKDPLLTFPDWETLPFDHFSPHHDIISERIAVLFKLSTMQKGGLIVPISTLCQRVAPVEFITQRTLLLRTHDILDRDAFAAQLIQQGYRSVHHVIEHGEFAIRGAILDIFPMGSEHPFRIELFDNSIESLRLFDPETQRSQTQIDNIHIMPAHEFPFDEAGISHFRKAWRTQFQGNPLHASIYQDVSAHLPPPGIEYYQALFFETMGTLFDYLPKTTLIIMLDDIEDALTHFMQEVNFRYEQLRHDVEKPILKPSQLYLPSNELFQKINTFKTIKIKKNVPLPDTITALPPLTFNHALKNPLIALEDYLQNTTQRVLFTAESLGRREHCLQLLAALKPTVVEDFNAFLNSEQSPCLTVSPLQSGVELKDFIIIPEASLLGQKPKLSTQTPTAKSFDPDARLRHLSELTPGTLVVHIDHGIGRYEGLKLLTIDERQIEFLCLEYAEKNKLYVPITHLEAISLYRGYDQPTLHTLGQDKWAKTKEKAAKRIFDVAAELLEVYAQREAQKGFACVKSEPEYLAFSEEFPFEETPDQTRAIAEVIQDMMSERPCDRLICGDVGFGKTEVAMRAAFLAVQNHKQVAILVPTTLLAQQHYESFSDRFAKWPVRIDVISRFRSSAETKAILSSLASGHIDIIIGTHKLLQNDIHFKNLGLLILDEEHRFGVKQKEALKTLKSNVDSLALTATPIPRTLNMAFAGMRDLSIIATPPARRLAIKTFVNKSNPILISEAIRREILRGGQVFFLHNDVASIESTADTLRALIPEARIEVGHGQMRERTLERVMSDFYHRRFHVLVCSTIIETGIDIPTANTIIIDRADKFGLAQLHQLRGRVGRSHHQAYAYLLIPERVTDEAEKRLEALTRSEELGSGFVLASQDLEIRGAGELLGEEQSGHLQAIGFTLYHELLNRSVNALKKGLLPTLEMEESCEIDLKTTAIIPEDYLPDVQVRLEFYKRLSAAQSPADIQDLQVELIDRFGLLPAVLKHLLNIHLLRLEAQLLKIKRIDMSETGGKIEFYKNPAIDSLKVIKLVQMQPDRYHLAGQDKLRFAIVTHTPQERIDVLQRLFKTLV